MTATHTQLEAPVWSTAGRAVVVGIDGSDHNQAAVDWAVQEAEATGRPLTLLAVVAEYGVPLPRGAGAPATGEDLTLLTGLRDRIAHRHPGLEIRCELGTGAAVASLVERSAPENSLVVGRRGLGTFGRILVGSTSIGVAGRATVPVVVVPDEWEPADHTDQPVVVGIDPDDLHLQTLLHAFNEAERRRVPLVVVHALDLQGTLIWDPSLVADQFDRLRTEHREQVAQALEPLRAAYPHVTVRVQQEACHPSSLILEYGASAQLVVLGRKRSGHLGGFAVGSVTRAVLHYATAPVAVVPSP